MKLKLIKYYLLISVATIIFGATFVVSKLLLNNHIPPVFMVFFRNIIGFLLMLIVMKANRQRIGKSELLWGTVIGLVLFIVRVFQFTGAESISPADSVMLLSLYVIIVPAVVMIIHKTKDFVPLLAAIVAFIGILILLGGNHTFGIGYILTLIASVFMSLQILIIDKKVHGLQVAAFVCVQFLVQSILGGAGTLLFERKQIEGISWSWQAVCLLLFLAVGATFLSDFLQNIAQTRLSANSVSLILSTQTLVGVALSVLIGLDTFSVGLLFGTLLIFAAILLSEMDKKIKAEYDLLKKELERLKNKSDE